MVQMLGVPAPRHVEDRSTEISRARIRVQAGELRSRAARALAASAEEAVLRPSVHEIPAWHGGQASTAGARTPRGILRT